MSICPQCFSAQLSQRVLTEHIYSDLTMYLSLMPCLVLTLSFCSDISVPAPEFRKIRLSAIPELPAWQKFTEIADVKESEDIRYNVAMFLQMKTTNQVKLTGLQMYFHCDGTTFCQNQVLKHTVSTVHTSYLQV